MAEHPDKPIHVRADTSGGWNIPFYNDPIVESPFGQISCSQRHHLSAENYTSRQQDAVSYTVSTHHILPMPLQFRHPMRWPRVLCNSHFPSFDSAHIGFGSDLGPTKFEARYGAANNNYTEAFKHQPAEGHVEPLANESRSPISGLSPSWLPSDCTEGFS